MKKRRQQGLTLVETLVTIAVMTVVLSAAYETVQQSLKLQRLIFAGSTRIAARCALAEQLSSDFRLHRKLQHSGADSWSLTLSDGSVVDYTRSNDRLVRAVAGNPQAKKAFQIGQSEVSFRGKNPGWLSSAADLEQTTAVRLKFADSELVVAR